MTTKRWMIAVAIVALALAAMMAIPRSPEIVLVAGPLAGIAWHGRSRRRKRLALVWGGALGAVAAGTLIGIYFYSSEMIAQGDA